MYPSPYNAYTNLYSWPLTLKLRLIYVVWSNSFLLFAKLSTYKFIRVVSHKGRNELKLVWDFMSVENLTSMFSQLFTCIHMNWGEIKLKPVWISYQSFWSCFHVGLKSQTSRSSFGLSYKRTLRLILLALKVYFTVNPFLREFNFKSSFF